MTEAEVLAVVQTIADTHLRVDRRIAPTDDFYRDLELESVDLMTLAIEIETRCGVALPHDASAQVRTVGDLCRLVAQQHGKP